jgi:glyoxylase-like metal-dependent hydrolase (beta-lactamase superfamily II)
MHSTPDFSRWATAATRYSARLPPRSVDRRFTGQDENISLGERTIRAVHIPGHSPGSVDYLTSSSGLKILFAQDVHGPLHPSLLSNSEDYLASLQRLIDLDADILCEATRDLRRKRQYRSICQIVHALTLDVMFPG